MLGEQDGSGAEQFDGEGDHRTIATSLDDNTGVSGEQQTANVAENISTRCRRQQQQQQSTDRSRI